MATRLSKCSFTPIRKPVFTVIFCLFSMNVFAQLSVDAGKDTTYCSEQNFNLQILGAASKVTNGKPPYKFAWECDYRIMDILSFTASFMLNDTTLQTPAFKNIPVDQVWLKFTLTVTDSENSSASDSLFVRFSRFVSLTGGGQPRHYIEKGDSILLTFPNSGIGGGIEPLTYYWRPKTYLSDPDSLVTWCKPDSSIQYEEFAIDSCGCVSTIETVYDIRVLPKPNENNPEFAPIGAEWYYSQYVGFDPPQGANYVKHTCFKDSTIDGKLVKVIQKTKFTRERQFELGFEYLHQNGDTISYWKNGEFHELYNFSLEVGDSMLIYSDTSNYMFCDTSHYGWVSIDSVFTVIINNQKLKGYFATHKEGSYWGFDGFPIIEKIGSILYLLPGDVGCVVDALGIGPLRCYSDSEFGIYYNGNEPCDTLTTFPDYAPVININHQINIFPNPANDFITISNPSNTPFEKIELIDFSGRVVQAWCENETGENKLNIRHIQPGIYLLKATTEAGIKTGKLIVE